MKSKDGKVNVHFEPEDIDISVKAGTSLLQAAIDAGVYIAASCGGEGQCGTCRVLVQKGDIKNGRTDRISDEDYAQGYRQACQSMVLSDVTVYIPIESRLDRTALIRDDEEIGDVALSTSVFGLLSPQPSVEIPPVTLEETMMELPRTRPPLSKFYVRMPPPTLEDNTSDLTRLLRTLKQQYKLINLTVDFEVVRKLPQMLRDSGWEVTVTTIVTAIMPSRAARHRPRVINIEPGDTRDRYYSLAIDIGTTSVCGQLLDLNQRRVIAQNTDYNRQVSYGQDVISRIAYCQKPGGLETLQRAIVANVNGIIKELLTQSGVHREDIGHFIIAGNTTMIQIFMGIDPKYVRLAPYVPTANFMPPVKANELGIELADHVYIHSLPMVASYIGADIVSGVLGSGMHRRSHLTLYIDIGTNGQIVIGNSEWMVTAACSAGPAFEGGDITHGMIATAGAIEDFEINPDNLEPKLSTINNEMPKGICGSGLISIIAGLFVSGVIGQNGKFNTDLSGNRLREGNDGFEYVLAWAQDTQIGKDIVITEIDIENLLRAKAAMYAGFQTIARSVGINLPDLAQVIIAGSFGNYIDIEKAITIGLLPDLPKDRFTFIGNGSLLGVRLTSFFTDMIDDARMVATMMTNVELSENADFMNNYVAALFLPHTSDDEFPSVRHKLKGMTRREARF
ncbi:MAG: ASKHA domain-containing protein [Chloroflexota bacterium]